MQVKLLKIDTDGTPVEFNSTSDDITLNSYTVQGGGPALSGTGLDLNGQSATDAASFQVTDPTTGFLNQTAGNLTFDNIMAKERNNVMTTAGAILFPTVTDTGAQVDSFKIPNIAGAPTATPTFSATAGYLVYDSINKNLYAWDGVAWDNLNTVSSSQNIDDTYVAAVTIASRDVVYLSAADNVSPATAATATQAQALGFATAGASAAATVTVRKFGRLAGFTGLTAGSRYYVDGTTPGTITATVPTGSGHTIVQAGYAKNTTTLDIMIQNLGRRA